MTATGLQQLETACANKDITAIADLMLAQFGIAVASVDIEKFLTAAQISDDMGSLNFVRQLAKEDDTALLAQHGDYLFDRSLDFLATDVPETPSTYLRFAANRWRRKVDRVALVATVRNEGPWLLEWISYHKSIGFSPIVVIYNDSDDGTELILEALHRAGEIIAIKNDVSPNVSPQRKAYNAACLLSRHLQESRWVAFLDADEFLVLRDGELDSVLGLVAKIHELSSRLNSRSPDVILLNWKWYASPREYYWSEEFVTERFRFASNNGHVKSLVRTEALWSMSRIHVPTLIVPGLAVNSEGNSVSLLEQSDKATYGLAQVNHYFAKSFQEFVSKKRRGRGSLGLSGAERDYENFMWGCSNLMEQQRVSNEGAKEILEKLMASGAVSEAHQIAIARFKREIERLEKENGLKATYTRLSGFPVLARE